MRITMKPNRLVALGAAAALGAAGAGAAVAAGVTLPFSGDGNTINGCYSSGGALKVLTPTQSTCPDGYTPIHWSVTGPQGPIGPQGPAGPQGTEGPAGPQGPAGLSGWGTRTTTLTLADQGSVQTLVGCPPGEKVLGGGVTTGNPTVGVDIGNSGPIVNAFGSGWEAIVTNTSGFTTDITVSAICAFTS
jgi:hypothetical protein